MTHKVPIVGKEGSHVVLFRGVYFFLSHFQRLCAKIPLNISAKAAFAFSNHFTRSRTPADDRNVGSLSEAETETFIQMSHSVYPLPA